MGQKQKTKQVIMTEGVIWKQLLAFSMPLLVGNLFQQLYNTVDSIVVGNFIGSEALAAVGSSNSLINLIIGMFMGIATGAGVIISQYYGAKDDQKLHWAVHTCMALSLIGGTLLIVLGVLLSPLILKWMGTPEDIPAALEQSNPVHRCRCGWLSDPDLAFNDDLSFNPGAD